MQVFEFWGLAPAYLTEGVEAFMSPPQAASLGEVLTDARWQDLQANFRALGWPVPDVQDLRQRTVLSFLQDEAIGRKRLISLPGRFTGALNGGRPGVTTPYAGSLQSMDEWWRAWLDFMFSPEGGWTKIKPHPEKYHSELTAEEIEHSQALQAIYLMLFDGCMVMVLNTVAPGWPQVKRDLLQIDKVTRCAEILARQDADVVFIQEASAGLRSYLASWPGYKVAGPPTPQP